MHNVVREFPRVRQQFADRQARLAETRELENARRRGERRLGAAHRRLALVGINGLRHFFAKAVVQVRLGIEQVDLRRAARLHQVNDALRFGREMR